MQLSKKSNNIFEFFIAFLELTSDFEHFEKEDEPQSLSISESMDSEKRVYLNF